MKSCIDCGNEIKKGKRCHACAKTHKLNYAKEYLNRIKEDSAKYEEFKKKAYKYMTKSRLKKRVLSGVIDKKISLLQNRINNLQEKVNKLNEMKEEVLNERNNSTEHK